METHSLQCHAEDHAKLVSLLEHQPDLVLIFGPYSLFKQKEFSSFITEKMGNTLTIGCSSSGEIYRDTCSDDTVVALAMKFAHTKINHARARLTGIEDSYEAGASIAQQLAHPDLKAIFTLSLGVRMNGCAYVRGLHENSAPGVVISGGLAGDGIDFLDTYTLLNGEISNEHAVAVGLLGDHIRVSSGSAGGWEPFGPHRRVTGTNQSILYTLDNKAALPMYMQYIGNHAQKLPYSALKFPFAIMDKSGKGSGLIRTILNVNHEDDSITFAGELPENGTVCLMHSDTDMLVNGAIEAAKQALPSTIQEKHGDCVSILVSCVGRKQVMGTDVDEEVAAVRDVLGHDCEVIGFHSFGEICKLSGTNDIHFHNQTMTITHLYETTAG